MAVQWVVVVLCTSRQGLRMLGRKVAVLITGVDRVWGLSGAAAMEGTVQWRAT